MNTIQKAFEKSPLCIPFLTVGYPSDELFVETVLLLAKSGCSLIEIGFPFSDPIADGPVIQKVSQSVLDRGMTLKKAFALIAKIRHQTEVPLVIMTYSNIVFSQGLSVFVQKALDCGVDGLLVPDMLFEESDDLYLECLDKLALNFFLSSLTSSERKKKIFRKTTGFVYCISRLGVTGVGGVDLEKIRAWIGSLKRETDKNLAVGFGFSDRRDVAAVKDVVDGIIIGSALISQIDRGVKRGNLLQTVEKFIDPLVKELQRCS